MGPQQEGAGKADALLREEGRGGGKGRGAQGRAPGSRHPGEPRTGLWVPPCAGWPAPQTGFLQPQASSEGLL